MIERRQADAPRGAADQVPSLGGVEALSAPNGWRRWPDVLWRALFPARCLGCGRRGVELCDACAKTWPVFPGALCPRCLSRLSLGATCRVCRSLPPSLHSVRASFPYEGLARTAVHTLKFRSGRYLIPLMGAHLRATAQQRPLRVDLVVAVPIAPAHLRERGFNQAALLAAELAPALGADLKPGALERQDRPAQRFLTRMQRRRNLLGAITCPDPELVRGRSILLVDDVMTTGATLSVCADVLATAGAQRVYALVFARDL